MPHLWDLVVASIWLFLVGAREALCLHRCVVFFVLDARILELTARCFLLNGAVFLGSIAAIRWALKPTLGALLDALVRPGLAAAAEPALDALLNYAWLLPAYAVTFALNCMWYSEIAELTAAAAQRRAQQRAAERRGAVLPPPHARPPLLKVHRADPLTLASQEAYKALLLCVFFCHLMLAGLVPVVGPALSGALLSWLYALYCFDYKWALHGCPLHLRIRTLEQGWAFFLGFGTVAALPTLVAPFYTGAALVGVLFPLLVITACDANPKEAYRQASERCKARGRQLEVLRLPVFGVSVAVTNALVCGFSLLTRVAAGLSRSRLSHG